MGAFRTGRSVMRLMRIVRILAKHDAGAALGQMGLAGGPLFVLRACSRRKGGGRPGQKLARALTDLGPSFIKLGQSLSTRGDLLGEEIARDLTDLQDHVAPFTFAEARATLESELEAPLEQLFETFDEKPISAASMAQVHFAVTREEDGRPGKEVAVKVLRPGIDLAFERDLELFAWLAALAERTQPRLRRLKPREIVALFAEQVHMELDLRIEAAGMSEINENFEGDETYNLPQVDWRRTGKRVLTMTRMVGTPMDDRQAMLEAGHDLEAVMLKAATIFFHQVFRDGVFHGDQHPGNMGVDREGNIFAVDFGILGRLDRRTRFFLADMMVATLRGDYYRLAEVQVEAGYLPAGRSLDTYAQALRSVCEPIVGRPLHEISFAKLLRQLFSLTESFQMQVQPQLLLLQKNMMMAEGISRILTPELNIWQMSQPLIERWIIDNRGPAARVAQTGHDLQRIMARVPQFLTDLEAIAGEIRGGGLKLHPGTLERLERRRGRGLAWLSLLLSLSALVLALIAVL